MYEPFPENKNLVWPLTLHIGIRRQSVIQRLLWKSGLVTDLNGVTIVFLFHDIEKKKNKTKKQHPQQQKNWFGGSFNYLPEWSLLGPVLRLGVAPCRSSQSKWSMPLSFRQLHNVFWSKEQFPGSKRGVQIWFYLSKICSQVLTL